MRVGDLDPERPAGQPRQREPEAPAVHQPVPDGVGGQLRDHEGGGVGGRTQHPGSGTHPLRLPGCHQGATATSFDGIEGTWARSSHSSNEGGACVEVATTEHTVLVRGSKDVSRPHLAVSPAGWTRFVRYAAGS
ncbi:DUF397 domain-containing protein [Streptomyces sp. NPDC048438]|uniref:DUF397 domain-containing protein n=1 Tax=Streptomyces sp. NPDC048438 TaxID=3365551 RepID=UPI0037177D53